MPKCNWYVHVPLPPVSQVTGGDFSLGSCRAYAPRGCTQGYASSDVFFLETCVFDAMCSNRESMWKIRAGEHWHCDMEWDGYERLGRLVLQGHLWDG